MSLRRLALSLAAVIALAPLAAAPLAAQVTLQSAVTPISTGGSNAVSSIAVAPNGDIYAAQYTVGGAVYGNDIFKYPANGTGPVIIPLGPNACTGAGCDQPNSVAVDANGNVYVAATVASGSGLLVIPAGSTTASVLPVSGANQSNQPNSVSVVHGLLYVADYSGGQVYSVPVGTGGAAATVIINSGYTGATADAAGNVYVDNSNASSGGTVGVIAYTAYTADVPATSVTPIAGPSGAWSYPQQLATDAIGNLYVVNSWEGGASGTYTNIEEVTTPSATPGLSMAASGAEYYSGVAFDAAGNFYYATYTGSGSGTNLITEQSAISANLRGQAVASTSTATTFTFTFGASTTLNAANPVLVLTQGASGLDYALASNTCTGTVSSTCTVTVTFDPKAPGLREGAVVLQDNTTPTPVRLATVFLSGTGVGPASTFLPQTPANITSVSNGGAGVAFDAAGDIFYGSNAVADDPGLVEELLGGTGSPSPVGTGTGSSIGQIAVDGAGNLYFADPAAKQVDRVDAGTGAVTHPGSSFANAVNGIAVDGAGNLYIADTANSKIVEIPAANPGTPIPFPGVSPNAYNLALDGQDNLFISTADGSNAGVQELNLNLATGNVTAPIALTGDESSSLGIAVDGSGAIYLADAAAGVVKYPTPTTVSPTSLASTVAYSVAVDSKGNVIYTDTTNAPTTVLVQSLPFATPPSIVFANTALDQTSNVSLVFANAGNANLSISALSTSLPYFAATGSTCTTVTSLAAAASCELSLTFEPTDGPGGGSGTYSGSAIITSNNLNAAAAQQTVNLSGLGTQTGATQLVYNPVPAANLFVGGNFGTVTVDEEDSNGIIEQADSTSTVTVTIAGPVGYTAPTIAPVTLASGTAAINLSSYSLTIAGTYTVTAASSPGDLTAVATVYVQATSATATTENVSSPSDTLTVTFASPSASVGSIAVLTQGRTGGDFAYVAGGSCTMGTNAGPTCTVNYTFTPAFAGLRQGAVVLFDGSSPANPLATIYLQGTGTGAVAAFPGNAAQSTVASPSDPTGLATDGSNFYTVASGVLDKISSGGTITPVYSGLSTSNSSVVVDGAGNVFTLDSSSSAKLEEFTNQNGTLLSTPITIASVLNIGGSFYSNNLAVDAAGNLYVAGGTMGNIYEYPAAGRAAGETPVKLNQFGAAVSDPSSVAVDPAGDVFFMSGSDPGLSEIPVGTTAVTGFSGGIYNSIEPEAIAFDAAGNFYDIPTATSEINEYANITSSPTLVNTFTVTGAYLSGLALDPSGNIYYADAYHGVGKLTVSTPPTLAFSTTQAVGTTSAALSATVSNVGNANLVFTTIALNTDTQFAITTPSGACATGGYNAIGPGNSCTATADFAPTTAGSAMDTIELTDTASASALPQGVPLTGTALATTLAATAGTPQSAHTSAAFSTALQITVTDSSHNPVVGLPVTFTAPASGQSGIFSNSTDTITVNTIAGGIAIAPFTANATVGAYTVTAAAPDASNSASFSLSNVAPATQFVVTPAASATSVGGSVNFTVTAEAASGATDTAYTGTVVFTSSDTAAVFSNNSVTLVSGTGSFSITLNTAGNQTITATDATPITGTSTAVTVVPYAVVATTTNVGVTSTSATATLYFAAATPVTSIVAMTNGLTSGTDFAVTGDGTGGTCNVSGFTPAAGSACTVNYTFSPVAAGVRKGAIVAYDASGNPLETIYLSGTGTGPVAAFAGTTSVLSTTGVTMTFDSGLASDGVNFYLGTTSGGIVYKVAGNGAVTTVCSSCIDAGVDYTSVALDGAGNLYAVSDNAHGQNSTIYKIANDNGTLAAATTDFATGLDIGSAGNGGGLLAVDAAGNLDVAVYSAGTIVQYPLNGGTPVTLASGLGNPHSLAFDPSGRIYYIAAGALYRIPAAGGAATPITGTGTVYPSSGVDAAGDFYNAQNSTLYEYSISGTTATQTASYALPGTSPFSNGLVIDGAGNVYVDDAAATPAIQKITVSAPPTLAFGSVDDGVSATQTAAVANVGNASLTFTSIATGTSQFAPATAASNPCSTSTPLGAGAQCNVAATFTPNSATSFSDSLTLTDTAPGGSQALPLSGSGLAITLSTSSGSDQSTHISTAFSSSLVVKVTDSTSAAVQGVVVTFSGSGIVTNTATTDINGNAIVTVTATSTPILSYTVTASASSYTSSTATFSLTNVGAATHLAISALPTSLIAGGITEVTVQALDTNNQVDTTQTNTIAITSNDSKMPTVAPAALAAGAATFDVKLETASTTTSITATDLTNGAINAATASPLTVAPAAESTLALTAPTYVNVGASFSVGVTAIDAYGNTIPTDGNALTFTDAADPQAVLPTTGTLSSGLATVSGFELFNASSAQTITASDGNVSGTVSVTPVAYYVNLGNVAEGATSSFNAPYLFSTGSGDAIASIKVLTNGQSVGAFSEGSGCALTTYTAGQACVVSVNFSASGLPAGIVSGAVVLADAAGHRLGTVYLSANVQAPTLAFTTANGQAPVVSLDDTAGYYSAATYALARDGAGNLYFSTQAVVYEWMANHSGINTVYTDGSGYAITAIALNAAGDLYVADGSGVITEVPNEGGTLNPGDAAALVSEPQDATALLADSFGNLFFTEGTDVLEYPSGSNGAVVTVANTLIANPYGIALDAQGNLWVADYNAGAYEIPVAGAVPASPVTPVLKVGGGAFSYLGFDNAGQLYIFSSSNSNIQVYQNNAGAWTANGDRAVNPTAGNGGLVIDNSGNIYTVNLLGAGLSQVNVQAPPTVAFDETINQTSSPSAVTITNLGNLPLTISSQGVTAGGPVFSVASATCASPLAPAGYGVANCVNQLQFAPTTIANAQAGTFTTVSTDPLLPTAVNSLTGNGIGATTSLAFNPATVSITYGTDISETITAATATGGSPAYGAPTGTFTYNLDGGTATTTGTITNGAIVVDLGRYVPAGTHTLNVTYSGDSTYASTTATLSIAVAQYPITAKLTGPISKGYDGTTNYPGAGNAGFTSSNYVLSGVLTADSGNVYLASYPADGQYNYATVAQASTVTVTGLSLAGSAALNYILSPATATGTAGISARGVTESLTGTITKAYDGTTTATGLTSANYAPLNGVVSPDVVTLAGYPASGTYNDPTVAGANTVTVSGLDAIGLAGSASSNYALYSDTAAGTAHITPATITPSLTGTVSKIYNGTTTATLAAGNYSFTGAAVSDTNIGITNPPSGAYPSKNIGTGLLVTVTGIALTGSNDANYQISSSTVSGNVGTITAYPITVGIVGNPTLVYTGQAAVSLSGSNYEPGTLFGSDNVTIALAPSSGTFASVNAGSGITVTAGGSGTITLGGTDGANYSVANSDIASGTGTITAAPLTVTANNLTAVSGAALPTLTATITGYVNGESATTANLTGAPSFSTSPTAPNPTAVGVYTITPAQGLLSAPNYTFTTFDNGTLTVTQAPVTFTSSVGTPAATQTVTFLFPSGATIGAAVMQGSTDFSSANLAQCQTSFVANGTCSVTVAFTPSAPGLRQGAVVLYTTTPNGSSSDGPLYTIYLSGTGQGAAITFPTGVAAPFGTTAGLSSPQGLVIDAAGDVFAAESGSIVETTAANGNVSTVYSNPAIDITSIAIDGSGNLYGVVPSGPIILVFPNEGGTINSADHQNLNAVTTGYNPQGIAFDANGNLYFSDSITHSIIEATTNGSGILGFSSFNSPTTFAAGTNFTTPTALAFDSAGNLYVADNGAGSGQGAILKVSPAGTVSTYATGTVAQYGQISGLTTDAAGDLYISSSSLSGATGAWQLTPAGVITQLSTKTNLVGIAVDSANNLYYAAGTDTTLTRLDQDAPTPVNFASTQVNTSSAATAYPVFNAGNAALSFSSIGVGTSNFSVTSSPCSTSTAVAAGTGCSLSLVFNPQASGALSDTLTLNDNAFNNGTQTATLAGTATALGQTITFPTIVGGVVYGEAPITLSATATSGLPVTFTVKSGPGTISDGVLTITGAASIVVAANQAGNTTYAAAPEVDQTLNVALATLTVTANPQTRLYGAANPTATYTITGFVNGDNSSVVSNSPTLTYVATATTGVGASAINVSTTGLYATNYVFTGAPGVLTITPAPLSVNASSVEIYTGQVIPTFGEQDINFIGFQNGDTALSAVTGSASITTNAPNNTTVGVYAITPTPGTLSAANYSFTSFNPGILTILQGPTSAPTTAAATGVPSNSFPVSFAFPFGQTIASAVVQSNGSTEFASADAGNCVGTFAAGTTCTVDVTFTPGSPGLRSGAVVLSIGTGQSAGTVYLSGLGTGALLTYPSAPVQSTVGTVRLTSPSSIVSNAPGDLYILDNGASSIVELNNAGTQTLATIPVTESLNNIALDAAGNLYFTVASANATYKIPAVGGVLSFSNKSQIGGTVGAYGLAVDGSGNVYTSGSAGGSLAETTSVGTFATLGTGVSPNAPIAVDSYGNVYTTGVSATSVPNTGIIQITPGGTQSTIAPTLAGIQSLGVDPAGDIYAATATGLVMIPAGAPTTTIALASNNYLGIIVKANGGVYGVDGSSAVSKVIISAAPASFTFGSVQIGQSQAAATPLTMLDTGNVAATFSSISISDTDFSTGASTCAVGTSVAPGASCTFAPAFTPASAAGALTANLSFANNNDVTTGSLVSISLAGTAVAIPQTITFPTIQAGGAVYGEAPITLSATGGASGQPVVFTVKSGPGSITGDILTITGATAAIVVAANQAGNTTYAAATEVDQTLNVALATLTVTVNPQARVYGAANPTATYTVSGYVNGDTASVISGTPSITYAATTATGVGPSAIAVNVSSMSALPNYVIAGAPGVLTITPAPLAIAAANAASVYGAALPTFTGTVTGQQNGDTFAETFSTTATSTSPTGTYPITPSVTGANLADYTVTPTSGTLTITAASQTITFPTIEVGGAKYGQAPITLSATGGASGQPVVFTVKSGPGTISGSTLTITGAASIVVAANQAASTNYAAATEVDQTLNVALATLTVTANPQARVYGAANPTATYTVSGYVNGDTSSVISGTPTLTYAATTATGVGPSAIAVNVSSMSALPNYVIAGAPGVLTITPAPLAIAAANAASVYGAALPTFTGTVTGQQNGDTFAETFSTTATSTSPTGTYPITPSVTGANLADYTVTPTSGTLTITATSQTITFPTIEVGGAKYGQAPITLSATGGASGQPVVFTVKSGPGTISGSTLTITGAASIVVAANQAASTNYAAATEVDQTLNVALATLTVTANPQARVYGAANPTATYTVSGYVNGDTSSVISGTPTLTYAATTATGVGPSAIAVNVSSMSALPNYVIAGAPGVLTITPAPLAIAAANAASVYGAALPTFTGTVTGQQNGDTFAETFSTTATSTSPTGTYPITPSVTGANLADYTVTPTSGTLTITAASQTITFQAVPFTVPGSVVTLSATATSGLAVTFRVVSGAATVSGNQLTVVGAGAITVEADQAGNASYAAAPPVDQTFSAGAPAVSLSAATLTFSSQTVNTTSSSQTITITNAGSSTLHVATVAASAPFAETTNCASVAAGASCSVNVTFTPTTAGAAAGTLTLSDDASGSPQTVALTGSGIAPGVSLSPAVLTFGSQPVGSSSNAQNLTILNTGSAALAISNVAVTGDFEATGTCASIAAGSSCSLNVVFTPSATGVRGGLITLTDNAGTQSVAAAGFGSAPGIAITPSSLVFPATVVGASSFPLAFQVTNSGTAPLSFSNAVVAGDFSISGNCGGTLAAGSTCTASVVYTPTLAGAETGTVTITDALGTQTVSLAGTGLAPGANLSSAQVVFGGQLAGTTSAAQTVILANSGSSALAITAVASSAGFADTTNCSGSVASGASCSVNIAFAPTTAGSQSGTVTITDAAGAQTIAVTGVGTVPGLTLAPSSASFGAQIVGTQSQAQTLTLTNSGTATLTLAPVTAIGDFIESDNCPTSFAPGASCQLSLTFAPSAVGSSSGAVLANDTNDLASTIAALSGTGTLPGISAAPGIVFFGSDTVGVPSAAQTVTVTNSGSAALTVSAVAVSGDFSEADTCAGTSIAPGADCIVSVTMTPSTVGTRTGTLSIYDNADGVHSVALTGSGQAAGATLSPTALAFGSAPVPAASSSGITLSGTPQTVILTNTGTLPLAISSIAINGDFTQTNTCGAAVAAGASCAISVAFSPTGLGQRTGSLTLTSNSPAGPQVISLVGDGSPTGLTLSPAALNFGGGAVGVASAPQTATLTNQTGSDIDSLAITASGEFTETDNCGATLANAASCTLNIVLTPVTSSGITGTISVAGVLSNSSTGSLRSHLAVTTHPNLAVVALVGSGTPAGIQLSASTLTYASEPVATSSAAQTLTITNSGSTALTGLAIASTPDFPETTTCGATLAAAASCTVAVSFDPTAAGARTGNLTITAAGGLSAQVALSGTATGGLLSVNPTTLAFGARAVDTTSAAQMVTISNTGSAVLTLQSITEAGNDFALSASTCGALPQNLAANATCTVAVTYTPSVMGAESATLTVASNFGTEAVALTGTGSSQGLALSPASLTFAAQGVGVTSSAQALTLTNTGTAAVALTSITATGDFAETNNCPASLAVSATCAVQVTFTPTTAGAQTGAVTVISSAATQAVTLSGTGTNYTVTAPASSAEVDAGAAATFQLSYTPGSFTGTVSLACSGLPQGAACGFTPATVVLAAGGAPVSDTLTITTTSRNALIPAMPRSGQRPWLYLLALSLFALTLLLAAQEPKRRRRWAMGALMLGALAAAGCGGATNLPDNGGGTPAGTYTITVTSTAGAATQHTTITLSVN